MRLPLVTMIFSERGYDSDLACRPAVLLVEPAATRALVGAQQKGQFFSKDPISQIILLGLDADQHFAAALDCANKGVFPFAAGVRAEWDVQFAWEVAVQNAHELPLARSQRFMVNRQVSERLQPVTKHLQQQNSCAVSKQFYVALVAVLVISMQWPDVHLPLRFLTGFRVVDSAEITGVFRGLPQITAQSMEKKTLLDGSEQYRQRLSMRLPTPASQHLLKEACGKDHQSGGAGPVMPASAMSRIHPAGWPRLSDLICYRSRQTAPSSIDRLTAQCAPAILRQQWQSNNLIFVQPCSQ